MLVYKSYSSLKKEARVGELRVCLFFFLKSQGTGSLKFPPAKWDFTLKIHNGGKKNRNHFRGAEPGASELQCCLDHN